MKNQFKLFLVVLAVLTCSSACERVIEIDLNDTSPRIVVEARLSSDSACTVLLSMTSSYFDSSSSNAVNDAVVVLRDDIGNSETLTFLSDGSYFGTDLLGVVGRTYTLTIEANGETYEAIETIPVPVNIDSIGTNVREFFGYEFETLVLHFSDPAGERNYYEVTSNSVDDFFENENSIVFDDELNDGEPIEAEFGGFAEPGDTIFIELNSLTEGSYTYLRTLDGASNNGGISSAAPYNPTSNVNNDALGYFRVWSTERDTFVAE